MPKISLFSLYPEKATRVQLQYNSLKALGYDVEIVSPRVPVSMNKGIIGIFLKYSIFFVQLLTRKTDIIHFSNIPDYPAIALLLRRKPLIIYDIRSIFSSNIYEMTKNEIASNLTKLVEISLIRKADLVLCANRYIEILAQRLGAQDTATLPNYPPEKIFKQYDRTALRKKHQIDDDVKIFLLVSTLTKQKPIDLLIKSFIDYSKNKNSELWLVGDGKDKSRLMKVVENSKSVKFIGYIQQQHLGEYISISDVCLAVYSRQDNRHPKLYSVESVLKVGEYALYEKPIIGINMMPDSNIIKADFSNLGEKLEYATSFDKSIERHTWGLSEEILKENYFKLAKKI